jgi:hypothetical protein
MKIKGRKTPFWAFRYSTSKRTTFSIYRIVEASTDRVVADKRIGSSLFYSAKNAVHDTKDIFSYSTFVKNFHDITKLSNEYKRRMLMALLESYK